MPDSSATTLYLQQKQAFLELLELEEQDQGARLAQIQAQSPELAQALRHQLDAAGQELPLLDRSDTHVKRPDLGQYRILRELGRGGMGVVWLAERELGDARQQVALKQIVHAHWDSEDLRRFQRERRILAALDHPNIAALVDGGTDANGNAFLATQFVDGERLDRWCEAQAPGVRARVQLMLQVVAAVAHAHARLIVHRDLKPANILVNRDGIPKLLDFGIARTLQEDAVTADGSSHMTLRYAAPEQVAGDGGEAGVGVDIYALGVLLYELLACASPYGQAQGTAALLQAIVHEEPSPPSRKRSALAGVDGDLDAICLKALRKRAQDRYASASDLRTDLERWLLRRPVAARRGERGYQMRSFLRRRWPWLVAASLGAAALVYHFMAVDRQLAAAERQRDKAQALADQFGLLFAEARPAETEAGEISARELLERSVDSIQRDRERPPATRAALLLACADALNYLGHTQSALDAAREAMKMAMDLQPADPDLLAAAHSELGGLLSKTGDNEGARREAAAGLALFTRGLAKERERERTLQQQAAMFAENAGDRAAARLAYEGIVASTRAELHESNALDSYLAAQTNLATGEKNAAPASAERRLREALAVATQYKFLDQATLLPMRTYLAESLYNQNKLDEAREILEPTLAEARSYYGVHDVWLGVILNRAGNLDALLGDYARADERLLESGHITEESFGPDHPNTRASEVDRAIVSVLAGDLPEAERRLTAILQWMDGAGRGESTLAQFLRAAQAYVRARSEPTTQHFADALKHLRSRSEWKSVTRNRLASDWLGWLQSAQARAGGTVPTVR